MPIALFAYLGFEAPNSAAGEMHDPQKDVPAAIRRGSVITMLAYVLPVLAILWATPADEIADAGVMAALESAYSVYGPAAGFLTVLTALLFVFALLTQGSAWMMATDRMQAMAAADGAFFGGFFGEFSEKLGTPVRMNILSGVVSTVFAIAALTLVEGTTASVFVVVLTVAVSTLLISYLLIVPAVMKLRRDFPDVHRPYRVPGGATGFYVLGRRGAWLHRSGFVGRGLPRHHREPLRPGVLVRRRVGRFSTELRGIHHRHSDRGDPARGDRILARTRRPGGGPHAIGRALVTDTTDRGI